MDTAPCTPYPTDVFHEEWSLQAPYLTLMCEDVSQRRHSLRELCNVLRLQCWTQLLALHVTSANEQHRAQVAELAAAMQDATGATIEIAYVHQGYTGHTLEQAAANHGIALGVVRLPQDKRGFVLLPRRWVVERDFGWLSRLRRLADVLKGFHLIAFMMLMWKQALPVLSVP